MTDKSLSDPAIVELVLSGDTNAFGILVDRYSSAVYNLCLSACGRSADAEDAAQEAFIDAFIYLSSLTEPGKFKSWLFTIARRKSYKQVYLRRDDHDIAELDEILPSDSSAPLEIIIANEKSERVAEAMKKLSGKRKEVAELYYFDGMKVGEIAKRLALSENTVKSRLYDAREFLRKELEDMNENKNNIKALETKIKEQITVLSRYYALHGGGYDDGFDRELNKTIKLISQIGDDRMKQSYTASAMLYKLWSAKNDGERKTLREKIRTAAYDGGNAEVISSMLIEDILNCGDYGEALKYIDGTALPEIKKYAGTEEGDSAVGAVTFWRGRYLLDLKRIDEAKTAFDEAAKLIKKTSAYRANAIAARREIDRMAENAYDDIYRFSATAEGLLYDGGKLIFASQSGFFIDNTIPFIDYHFDSFCYYASRCRRTLYDASMKPGDKIADERNGATLECVSKDESLNVVAGAFGNCLHMRTKASKPHCGEYTLDAWYAPGVGLVKAYVEFGDRFEKYELSEYDIKGGGGYMPAAIGNRWMFVNPDLPGWVYQNIEHTVEYADEKSANVAVSAPLAVAKDFETSDEADSALYITLADRLCDEWKLDDALEMLKKAVRANSSEMSARIALYGIEVLTRFAEYQKKGWRFCPSSIGAASVEAANGVVKFANHAIIRFGPYRWGARGRYEDRIFGIKPFTYLNLFFKKLWDDNWLPGYREEKDIREGLRLVFTVEEGGSVTVPAGTFENCRKLTLRVDPPEDSDPKWFFYNNYAHMHCGVKEYWFAPGVGIVRIVSAWGSECCAECRLVNYSVPAASDDEYLPLHIGNCWEYDEPHLTAEGYRAKAIFKIQSGMNGKYLMTHSQEFVYLKSEEEYNEFMKNSHRY